MPQVNTMKQNVLRILFTIIVALFIGSIVIMAIGENPLTVYAALLRGAFMGRLGIGQTLAMFTQIQLELSLNTQIGHL